MIQLPIYLDNNATTQMDPRVLEAMLPYFGAVYGNASSRHHEFGWRAETAVDLSRETIAGAIGADPKEIIFTSGATESDNLAIKGVAGMYRSRGEHIITVATEHRAVLDTCRALGQQGCDITVLPVDQRGMIDLDQLRDAITPRTILVSVMHANNEIGTVQEIGSIGAICREHRVLFHTDATQALGKIPFNVDQMNVDLASFSAHKLYGPKGCGALYVRRSRPRVQILPQIDGGGHERGIRSGTLNVPGVVGFAKAVEISVAGLEQESLQARTLRDRLWSTINGVVRELHLNGPDPVTEPALRLPGNLNIAFDYVESEALMMGMKEIAISSGAACSSESIEPSHVLQAIGRTDSEAHQSIRFGVGRFTTEEEIDYTGAKVIETVRRLRELSPVYLMSRT